MSKITQQHVPCEVENCKCDHRSTDAFCWYEDGHGWCFKGNKGVFPKDKYSIKQFERCLGTDRGISTETMEKFDFHLYVDKDGEVHFHEYKHATGRKFRRVADKHFWIEGTLPALGGMDLWDPGSQPIITVVEGEIDAASAYQMLNGGRVKVERGVVWLNSAGIPRAKRKEIFDYLNQFQQVNLAVDNDEAGQGALSSIAEMLPTKTYKVTLRKHKDANAYLTAGDEDDFKRAWTNAARFVPRNIVNSNEDFFSLVDDEEKDIYIPTPFSGLNKLVKGLPLGHIVLVLGQEGLGKTEILRSFEWSLLKREDEDLPIGVLHFEEKQRTTLFGFSCYHLGRNVRNPDEDHRKEVKESIQSWNKGGRLHLFDIEEDSSVESVIETIRYLTVICGCKYIFVDPINQFGSMEIDDTKTKFFDSLAQSMEKFAVKHNVCFVWTAHANDEGKTRDSRMIGKACSIRIEIDRDLESSDPDIRNTTSLKVTKNRFCGETGNAGHIQWDPATWTLFEAEGFDPDAAVTAGGEQIKGF